MTAGLIVFGATVGGYIAVNVIVGVAQGIWLGLRDALTSLHEDDS